MEGLVLTPGAPRPEPALVFPDTMAITVKQVSSGLPLLFKAYFQGVFKVI